MSIIDAKLTVRKSDWLSDWYLVERAEHDGKSWLERTGLNSSALRLSSRLGNADIEGSASEMLELAQAIESHGYSYAKRCACQWAPIGVTIYSPRNSQEPLPVVTHARAVELAAEIRRVCASPARERKEEESDG